MKNQHWAIVISFFILVVLLRFSSFFQSVLSWDESLYLLVAEKLLDGYPPYTEIWDNKPPGIYFLFSLALIVFGHSVASIRIIACIAITITCYFLYRIGNSIGKNGTAIGLLAGIFYALASLNNGGIASNTDIFFTPLVTIAFYLFLSQENHLDLDQSSNFKQNFKLIIIGFILGIAFEIKYVVIFDFIALLLIMATIIYLKEQRITKYFSIIKFSFLLAIGFIFPFLIVTLWYVVNKNIDAYLFANFAANKARTVDNAFAWVIPAKAIADQIKTNLVFWVCLFSTPLYLLFFKNNLNSKERRIVTSLLVWFFIDLLCICLLFRGFFYGHYFLQITPALCLIASYLITKLVFSGIRAEGNRGLVKHYFVLAVLLMILIYNQAGEHLILGTKYVYFRQVKGIENWEDAPAAIGKYIQTRIRKDDYIYVVDYEPIIYFLTQAKIPTKYAFPPFLVRRNDLPNVAGINPFQELDFIMQKKPVYLVKKADENDIYYKIDETKPFYAKLNKYIQKNYIIEHSIQASPPSGKVNLYRFKG